MALKKEDLTKLGVEFQRNKGVPNGYAPLGPDKLINPAFLPPVVPPVGSKVKTGFFTGGAGNVNPCPLYNAVAGDKVLYALAPFGSNASPYCAPATGDFESIISTTGEIKQTANVDYSYKLILIYLESA